MRLIDRLTKKQKKIFITGKNGKNKIKYDMSLKSRIIMDVTVVLSMCLAPFLWAYTMVVIGAQALWGAFVLMPLEVRQQILSDYVASGVAKRKVDVTES